MYKSIDYLIILYMKTLTHPNNHLYFSGFFAGGVVLTLFISKNAYEKKRERGGQGIRERVFEG